ncbi:MAG: GAF domain-containing protein [Woeseia sp.]|nr:GAF domain-containing protein [Woeseia sp.]MBT8095540.1 GAF domain-containing protein [Woeseia sp.]NNE59852.1 GAF domain-containing protein [Woeseia sp.]NNL55865.1 GAF domain-containing protein [Woeseia sp.]
MQDDKTDFDLLAAQLDALIDGESDALANTANMVALIWQALPQINWAGFYVLRGSALVLGPFQGNPACVRIPLGQGVCGTAAAERRTQRVADVHDFAGHIACDAASRSELVVPLLCDGVLLGVLDIDSPQTDRFSLRDQHGIELLCKHFVNHLRNGGSVNTPFI